METAFKVDFEREKDGRWIAEVLDIPGVLSYGSSQEEAKLKVETLARKVLSEQAPSKQ